jgi:hypothetical protein
MELNLDKDALKSYYGDDLELCKMMFNEFINQMDTTWKSVEDAISIKDIPFAISQIHKVKPTFSMVGLANVHFRVDEFEKSLRINLYSDSELKDKFQDLQELVIASRKCVENELLVG